MWWSRARPRGWSGIADGRRIALVCEPPDGGVAEHVRRLAAGLPEHGYEPVVLDSRVLPFRRDYRHPHRDLQALGALVRRLRGFDLVHAHAAKAGVLARLAAGRRPVVYTPHCFPFVGGSAARRRFGLVVERALSPLTAATICVCEDEAGVARAAGLGRLEVVHNGCPACEPVEPALAFDGPVVGAVTVLRRQKRIDLLLAAAPRIIDAGAAVVVVGDGPEAEALRAAADPRVTFLPFRGPSARYLRALDVYVLPSDWEAFPIGLLEAQACGVPQVATDVGGTREALVPETGLLVPPGDPRALADAVIALLRDPGRRAAMSDASRARHAERFTVERMVAETAAVYDGVLRRRTSTAAG
jgi:glycosyltransferase involved in cell wall biosynthesis